MSVWITKIKRDPRYFNVNKHTRICSEHFVDEDFVNPYSTKRRLKSTAVPSVFAWSKEKLKTKEKTSAMLKLEKNRTENEEATDSASEGEGDATDINLISRKTQTNESDVCGNLFGDFVRIPCLHSFSVSHLLSKCTTQKKEEWLFNHFTGFNSHGEFMNTLQFLLPNLDRTRLLYRDSHARKDVTIDTETLFQQDNCESDTETAVDEDESACSSSTMTRPTAHKLFC